jgi:hypothetical protein
MTFPPGIRPVNPDEEGLPHDGEGCGPGCRHWEASPEEHEKDRLKREAKQG